MTEINLYSIQGVRIGREYNVTPFFGIFVPHCAVVRGKRGTMWEGEKTLEIGIPSKGEDVFSFNTRDPETKGVIGRYDLFLRQTFGNDLFNGEYRTENIKGYEAVIATMRVVNSFMTCEEEVEDFLNGKMNKVIEFLNRSQNYSLEGRGIHTSRRFITP